MSQRTLRETHPNVTQPLSTTTPERKFLGITPVPEILYSIFFAAFLVIGTLALLVSISIRLIAIKEFGTVIHEFDPWFNYRTTEFLYRNGWRAFFDWYDYQSWYPLGRPIGTTTYPGLSLTAVVIHSALRWLGEAWEMSLNDVCCFIPVWFGSVSTFLTGLITHECTQSLPATVFAALIMALIPSHIVRTVGGGFDNESVAIPAMCAVFYFWVRSLRETSPRSTSTVVCGVLAGVFYGFMVSLWGGFIYVTNIVALHAAILLAADWLHGQYSVALYQSYSLYFVIGTLIATRVPPVGMSPFKSLEQISALFVFIAMQILHVSEYHRKKRGIRSVWSSECLMHRLRYIGGVVAFGILTACLLYVQGYFGPLTARVRSLIIQHRSTGNPLVDSVAEHQPMSVEGLWLYSSYAFYFTPIGALSVLFGKYPRQTSFILLNLIVSWHFAMKMSRLIIFSSVPCAVLSGAFFGALIDKAWDNLLWSHEEPPKDPKRPFARPRAKSWISRLHLDKIQRVSLTIVFALVLRAMVPHASLFVEHCWESAVAHSQPQIVFSHFNGSRYVHIDDYRQAYGWLRENTPSDARVLAWWDYGYHITGISNRTSLADGNTWNHEHIALIGKCLCSPVGESHRIVRHLADYVLIWTGGGADDLAKSPWIARISNSVYDDICPNDPLCEEFGFHADGSPTPLMSKSTLYTLQDFDGRGEGLSGLFEKAYASENGLVSIFKVLNVASESKEWVANPANRKCPASGEGYRQGAYPPAEELQAVLRRTKQIGQ